MAVSGSGQAETPHPLATPAFAGFGLLGKPRRNPALTTWMTTDRKNLDFPVCRGIMAEIEYPGVAQLVARQLWELDVVRSSRTTRTKIPLKLLISEGFFLFFVYCGAEFE